MGGYKLSPIVPLEKLASALKLSLSEVKRLAEFNNKQYNVK
jgi:hypothetical protein